MVRARPLSGRRVVVTAPGRLAAALAATGAIVIDAGVIAIEAVAFDPPTGPYDWVAFTSANAVDRFAAHNVAAVGPATAEALRERGISVDLIPDEAVAEALVDAFPNGPGRVLLPQAAGARPTLADGLRAKGWDVDVLVVYRTVAVALTEAQRAAASTADAIAFTSSSTVANYLDAGGPVPGVVACIGPVTAATAVERGLVVTACPDLHTVDGLVAALVEVLA